MHARRKTGAATSQAREEAKSVALNILSISVELSTGTAFITHETETKSVPCMPNLRFYLIYEYISAYYRLSRLGIQCVRVQNNAKHYLNCGNAPMPSKSMTDRHAYVCCVSHFFPKKIN